MDLEFLKQYQGSAAEPEDFDTVWDEWIESANVFPLQYRLEEIDLSYQNVIYEKLYFKGMGDSEICCHLLRKKGDSKKPVVFLFHGYSANSGDIFDKLPYVYNDFAVAAMDVRGQGGLSEDHLITQGTTWQGHIVRGMQEGRENLFFKNVFLDTILLKRIVKQFNWCEKEKMAAVGFSQGGALSTVCAALNEEISFAAIGYPFLSDYRKACELSKNGAYSAYDEIQQYFRVRDPRHEREQEVFSTLDYIDVAFLAKRMRGKALCFVGLLDALVPLETQFAVFNRLMCEKEWYIYPEYGHEVLPEANDIILNELIHNFM